MDRNAIKSKVKEELAFFGFSDAIIHDIECEFDEIADTQINLSEKTLTNILESIFYIKAKELIENGNFESVLEYLVRTKSTGKKIFSSLNTVLKQIGVELSFDLGLYLINNYYPLSAFFDGIVDYLKNNDEGELKDIVNDESADLLFDLYCAKIGFKLNEKDAVIPGNTKDNYSEDSVRMYLNEIAEYPVLTLEEEQVLFKTYLESPDEKERENARKLLINCNLRWVIRLAKQYMTRLPYNKIPFLDLIQEGNIGLMKAVEKFDPSKGYKLSTYATWWIRQTISRYIGENGTAIRIPSHLDEKVRRVSRISENFLKENNREITIEELCQLSGYSKSIVLEAKNILRKYATTVSLDEPVG